MTCEQYPEKLTKKCLGNLRANKVKIPSKQKLSISTENEK